MGVCVWRSSKVNGLCVGFQWSEWVVCVEGV